MEFWLKKAVAATILPVPLACLLVIAGWLLWRFGLPRTGQGVLLLGPLLLVLLAFSPISQKLAGSLERRYPVWQPDGEVAYVLVLGNAHHSDPNRTALQQLSNVAMARLMEGIRIWRANPDAVLVVSGYGGFDPISHAEMQRRAAISLGVPDGKILILPQARDTAEEARLTASEIGAAPAVLVTSATHMPRAMRSYQLAGLSPRPAPTDFIAVPTHPWRLSARNLWVSERALHEYQGLLWLALRH
ncbi:ElyC/SanA/YdcF family protein [Ferrimonas gelatinilytica]|uniref:YdcF family protein n=1 Tax=Ferrimonas gelatinilytica TaxID=1255257 RepID=A0ABP9RUK5_9GAMM